MIVWYDPDDFTIMARILFCGGSRDVPSPGRKHSDT